MESVGIGLAGYMGAGKSTVARWLAGRGARVVDADAEAKRFMNASAALKRELAAAFGEEIIVDGSIDSTVLGGVVYHSFTNLLRLNGIVHPPLRAHFEAMVNAMDAPLWVMDAALIPLWKTERWFTHVFWIDAPAAVRMRRVTARTGLPEEALRPPMDMQQRLFPPPTRPPWRRLRNEGSVADLEALLERELTALLPAGGRTR